MTTDSEVRIKLSTPADIVDAIPYLVGFEPHESLVVLSLRGPRSRIGLTARIDLPGAKSAVACARNFVGYLKRDGAARAIIVFYPPSDGVSHPSVRPLADALTKHLKRARIEVCEVLCVYDGRWWSMQCTDAECCARDGTPIARDGVSALAVAMTVEGRVVLGSREELERMVQPVSGVMGSAMAYEIPRADEALTVRILDGQRAVVVAESIELFRAAVQARLVGVGPAGASPVADLTVDAAARLIAAFNEGLVRDEIVSWFDDEWGDATRGLLLELVRRAVPPFQVRALTTLAWVCYLQGQGVLAGIAIDRALTADPDHSFAQLLDQVLSGAVNPSMFQDALRANRTVNFAAAP